MRVMSRSCGPFVPFWVGERPRGGEAEPPEAGRGIPITYNGGSTKLGSTTPMETWAGEGNDWIKLMAQRQPRKEDVSRSLLESMKQAVEKKAESHGTRPTKKPRHLLLLELEIPKAGKVLTLEITSDCKTIVDWINGHAKLEKQGEAQ